ncbi:32058_t:CDS:2 [Gigaspora margarita]|uniref:32058_t:CDS:1 n=1 Tax=Gigaspora margarita TaxID=4874 RepID=A0ABN7V2I5_GIGMA|nr:32058_t:CDS:2 [Gigaspora margarita]
MSKKTCSQLNNAQCKQICEYHVKNPSAKYQDIADEFKRRYPELNLERSTVTKILKKKDQYLHIEENTTTQNQYKNRGPKYSLIEKAMNIWVGQVLAAGLVLTDELVKSKGREFGSLLGISEDELKFSNGEAASALLESLPNERIKLQNLLSQYELEDIYNADETGLFYRMLPNQTLAKRPVARSKQDKSRVTILLAANATSSHKLQPLVIGYSKKPRSFSGINLLQLLVTYKNNERAWIRTDIWEKWLRHIDSEFCIQDRKICYLWTMRHLILNSKNEVLMDDFSGFRDNDETEGSPESNKKSNTEAHMEDHAEAHVEDHVEAQAKDHTEAKAEDHA